MSMISRPLNPAAVAAADAKILPKTGGRKLNMSAEDSSLRKEWADAYREAIAEQEMDPIIVEEAALPPKEMGSSVQICPLPSDEAPCNCSFQKDFIVKKSKEPVLGADSPLLRAAMNELWKYRDEPNDPAVISALNTVAIVREQPLSKIQGDWQKYQELMRDQQKAIEESKENKEGKEEVPAINEFFHGEFMASVSQLRSGEFVGACLGVDPVFGALLNPTGGLVGPGNKSYDGNDSALGYHGAVHDAAGYLRNYHNKGPGYDYLGTDNRDTTYPLSGQRNGIKFWREQVGDDSKKDAAVEYAMRGWIPVADAKNAAVDAAKATYGAAVDAASSAWDWISK